MYQPFSSVFWKKAAVCLPARVSDQMGVVSRRSFPSLSTGITPRLWPEMARQSMSEPGVPLCARSRCVLSTMAFHQSSGRCSCQPVSGYTVW